MDGFLNMLQWPAMVATLSAAWLVASASKRRRATGFWCFMGSNLLWIIWGWHAGAYALITMQIGLFLINVKGANRNQDQHRDDTRQDEAFR